MKPHLTLLVPTREGMITLPGTLDSCLAVNSDAIEALVSDNKSGDGTEEYVRERAKTDSRLRYVQAPARLGMAEHWEFAIGEVATDYVCAIGDDDAVMPDIVDGLAPAIAASADLISWPFCAFSYGDTEYSADGLLAPGNLHLPFESYDGPQSTQDVISRFLQADVLPQHFRGVYHGACHVRLLQKARAKHGKLFLLPSNDTPAFMLPFCTDVDWRISQPVTLYAMSKKSQAGALMTTNPEVDRSSDAFWRTERATPWCTELGDLPASGAQLIDFITGLLRFGLIDQARYENEVNWTVYIARAWNELGPRLYGSEADRNDAFDRLRRFGAERQITAELASLIQHRAPRGEEECRTMIDGALGNTRLFPPAPALNLRFTLDEAPHARDVARLFTSLYRRVCPLLLKDIADRDGELASLKAELARCKTSWRSRGEQIEKLKARLNEGPK